MDDVIPAGAVGLYRLEGGSGAVIDVRAKVGTDFLDDYEDYGRDDDPVLDFVVAHRRPIDSSRVTAAQRWESCGAASALGVGGYSHSMEAPVTVSGALFGTVNFARTPDQPPFSGVDLVSARLTAEQLGLAAERALRFERTGRRTTMLEHVLDRIPQAVVVTDLEAQVLFRNRAAGNDPDLGTHGAQDQRLGVVSETIAEAMEEFRVQGKRVHTRSVRAEGSGRRVVIKSYRLSDQHNAAVTLLFDCSDEQNGRLPLWDVLSPREQNIAELVSQGLSTKQIAERAFISENTVKQHLKRVFAKTDVRNRAELVQLIWAAGSHNPSRGTTG
ncbi:LuxR C-terminal-related transcriptional regulator [Streptomyces sp. Li-HN-5-11]|uniref:LuxR C-terminal-related transcriptional regulator n=1 Tax=Streptomyces sp. Li-HN-5-11 TaxID=3075432 RepID=UPI0028A5A967|nr:LuxR C-terminal-related transcriptional regulator [Streptomyces sp. Li-HN-5-11]WNM35728.1 LuxR C-terminal-related transcriptional regulator [Streptomyces sp. Li-HN-5-11]